MQFMNGGPDTVHTFAILLPTFTLGAGLLVFNLENLISVASIGTEKLTTWFRRRMRNHHRKSWKRRAIDLHEDEIAHKAPVTEARRKSSAWVYPLFLLEWAFVALPIYEIVAFLHIVGVLGKDNDEEAQKRASIIITEDDDNPDSMAAKKEATRRRVEERINKSLQEELERERKRRDEERGIFLTTLAKVCTALLKAAKTVIRISIGVLRALFLPIWLMLVSTEYMTIAIYFFLASRKWPKPNNDDPLALLSDESDQLPKDSIWKQSWNSLGLEVLLPPPKTAPDVEDPEVQRQIRRVATQLGSIATPRVGGASPRRPSPTPPSTAEVNLRTEYAEDMIKVPLSTNVVTRRVDRGWRFASSGLNPELELEDMEMHMNAAGHG
jgi:hypothetical protein